MPTSVSPAHTASPLAPLTSAGVQCSPAANRSSPAHQQADDLVASLDRTPCRTDLAPAVTGPGHIGREQLLQPGQIAVPGRLEERGDQLLLPLGDGFETGLLLTHPPHRPPVELTAVGLGQIE